MFIFRARDQFRLTDEKKDSIIENENKPNLNIKELGVMQDLIHAVDKNRQLILDTERFVWQHPETGYKEEKTNQYMAEQFEKLGYELHRADVLSETDF